jgi:hypothetical protein
MALPPPDTERIAGMFLDFANGASDALPIDTPVTLHLNGREVRTFSSAAAGERGMWRPCPMAVSACPSTIPEMLAAHEGQIRISAGLPDTGCVQDNQEPLGWKPVVTFTPRDVQGCQGWFAVQLNINDVGQITHANVLMDWF